MLVWRLGKAHHGGLLSDSLFVRDDGVTLLDVALGVLFNEILNRPMKLMNDVFGNYVVQIMLDQCTFE